MIENKEEEVLPPLDRNSLINKQQIFEYNDNPISTEAFEMNLEKEIEQKKTSS